jgi:two-component sensor histidine kinase
MMHRETVIIRETREDPRIPQDAYRPTFVRSLVMTPVRAENPLGAIGAYWSHPRDPTPEEVESLSVMARATATAIENVGLLASLESALSRREALIRELDHRVKNTLAATLSIANQTLPGAATPGAFVDGFNGRVMALSRAHELLADRDWEGGELGAVLTALLADDDAFRAGRIRPSGPAAWMATETTVSVVLALHELLDNARRHGALSAIAGTVDICWSFGEGGLGDFALVWSERNGPPTSPPGRRGFGLRVAELGLARDLGGKVRVDFEPAGLTYSLTAPRSHRIAPA